MQQQASERLAIINSRITDAAKRAGRQPQDITLIGASKKQGAELVREFSMAGLNHVGENYLQEAIDKQSQLSIETLSWHFIGQIQSNKTSLIAQHFSWVHGVDRLKIARRFASAGNDINILVQLNPDNEVSKGGVNFEQAVDLCAQISELDGIKLRGFMMIPAPRDCIKEQRIVFARARQLLDLSNQQLGLKMDTLSMGMSGDLEAAILEGSTMVRIGTDLFGARS